MHDTKEVCQVAGSIPESLPASKSVSLFESRFCRLKNRTREVLANINIYCTGWAGGILKDFTRKGFKALPQRC